MTDKDLIQMIVDAPNVQAIFKAAMHKKAGASKAEAAEIIKQACRQASFLVDADAEEIEGMISRASFQTIQTITGAKSAQRSVQT